MNLKVSINFNKEINSLLGKRVRVEMENPDEYYKAILTGFDIKTGTISIEKAIDQDKQKFSKIIIKSSAWTKIFLEEARFPMEELSVRISKIFPTGQVKYDSDSETINILNGKIIVNEAGVQGQGPTAARVHKIFEEFIEAHKK